MVHFNYPLFSPKKLSISFQTKEIRSFYFDMVGTFIGFHCHTVYHWLCSTTPLFSFVFFISGIDSYPRKPEYIKFGFLYSLSLPFGLKQRGKKTHIHTHTHPHPHRETVCLIDFIIKFICSPFIIYAMFVKQCCVNITDTLREVLYMRALISQSLSRNF